MRVLRHGFLRPHGFPEGGYLMTFCAHRPATGHRRHNAQAARAGQLAAAFDGLKDEVTHRQVLTAFKRAAAYLGISSRLVHAIDTLMAWSRAVDWTNGERPIVFPSNETLSLKLGVSVRQVQKLLNEGVAHGLIWHRDSANGNRIGARGKDGRLIYAYGIDLSPLGSRYDEFLVVAEQGSAQHRRIDALRKRLTAARRRIHRLSEVVLIENMTSIDGLTPLNIAQLAAQQMRAVRDEGALETCVKQLEREAGELDANVARVLTERASHVPKESPSSEPLDTPNTTTIQPSTAKADLRSMPTEIKESNYDIRCERPQTEVEADLLRYGVDPSFIVGVAAELVPTYASATPSWSEIIGAAERWVRQTGIHQYVWHDACQIMGQRGAAASVLMTSWKYLHEEVERPGAYLRGLNRRALQGKLNLGRSFHSLKTSKRMTTRLRLPNVSTDMLSIGKLASLTFNNVRLGHGLA